MRFTHGQRAEIYVNIHVFILMRCGPIKACYLSGKMLMMPLHNEAFFSERDIITHNVLISLTSVLRVNTECKEEHSL